MRLSGAQTYALMLSQGGLDSFSQIVNGVQSSTMKSLERKGLVQWRPRKQHYSITPEGRRALKESNQEGK